MRGRQGVETTRNSTTANGVKPKESTIRATSANTTPRPFARITKGVPEGGRLEGGILNNFNLSNKVPTRTTPINRPKPPTREKAGNMYTRVYKTRTEE